MLSPPDAELMPRRVCLSPGSCGLGQRWFGVFFSARFADGDVFSLSVSWAAAGALELFEMEQSYLLLPYKSFLPV